MSTTFSETKAGQYYTGVTSSTGEIEVDFPALHQLVETLIAEGKAPVPYKKAAVTFEQPSGEWPILTFDDHQLIFPWQASSTYEPQTNTISLNQAQIYRKFNQPRPSDVDAANFNPQTPVNKDVLTAYYEQVYRTRKPEATQRILEQQKITLALVNLMVIVIPLLITIGDGLAQHEALTQIALKEMPLLVIGLIVSFSLWEACDKYLAALVDEPHRFGKDNQNDPRLADIIKVNTPQRSSQILNHVPSN